MQLGLQLPNATIVKASERTGVVPGPCAVSFQSNIGALYTPERRLAKYAGAHGVAPGRCGVLYLNFLPITIARMLALVKRKKTE